MSASGCAGARATPVDYGTSSADWQHRRSASPLHAGATQVRHASPSFFQRSAVELGRLAVARLLAGSCHHLPDGTQRSTVALPRRPDRAPRRTHFHVISRRSGPATRLALQL